MSKDTPKSPKFSSEPQILGEVLPDELQRLTGLKQQADHMVMQIGHAFVSAFRMMGNIQQAEVATNQIIKVAGERLGIPEGTAWSVTMDGKAVLVNQPMPMRPRPVPAPEEVIPETTPESDEALGETKE